MAKGCENPYSDEALNRFFYPEEFPPGPIKLRDAFRDAKVSCGEGLAAGPSSDLEKIHKRVVATVSVLEEAHNLIDRMELRLFGEELPEEPEDALGIPVTPGLLSSLNNVSDEAIHVAEHLMERLEGVSERL